MSLDRNAGTKALVARGAIWLSAARLIVNLIGFASTILLARLLVPDDFGIVAIASTTMVILTSFSELPLSEALIQHEDVTSKHIDTVFTLTFIRSILVLVILVSISGVVANFYNDERLKNVFLIVSISTFVGALASPNMAICEKRLSFWQEFIVSVSQKTLGFIVSLIVAWATRSYWALVWGWVVSQFVSCLISYLVAPYRPRFSLLFWRELLSYSIWLSLSRLASTLNWRFDQFIIGYLRGAHDVGIYSVADNLSGLPTREAVAPITRTLLPAFATLKHDPSRLERGYRRSMTLICALAFPIGTIFAMLAKPVVFVFLGTQWDSAVVPLQVLALSSTFWLIAWGAGPLAMATGRTRGLFYRDIANLCVRVPLVTGGLLAFGFVGVLVARCIQSIISVLISLRMVGGILKLKIRVLMWDILIYLLSSIGVGVLLHYVVNAIEYDNGVLAVAIKCAILGTSAFVLYITSIIGVWWVRGRPDGPESELIELFRVQILARMRMLRQ